MDKLNHRIGLYHKAVFEYLFYYYNRFSLVIAVLSFFAFLLFNLRPVKNLSRPIMPIDQATYTRKVEITELRGVKKKQNAQNLTMQSPQDLVSKSNELAQNNQEASKSYKNSITKDTYLLKMDTASFAKIDFKKGQKVSKKKFEKVFLQSFPKNLQIKAKPYIRPIIALSIEHNLDPFWVASVMWTESHFNWRAKSHVGARGLMQVMPRTKKWLYSKYTKNGNKLVVEKKTFRLKDYFDLTLFKKELSSKRRRRQFKKSLSFRLINIELGVIYLKKLLIQFKHNYRLATVAYNMGPGWTRRRLRKKLPVGKKNKYLAKVSRAYTNLGKKMKKLDREIR